MRKLTLVLVAAWNLMGAAQADERHAQAEALAAAQLAAGDLPGLAVSIGHKNELIWSRGFGFADMEMRVPVDPSVTRFRVGSTAKPMTAVAIGLLYQEGRLDLDLPIQHYAPDFPKKPEGEITTRQLAGHLAGIRHYQGDEFLSNKHYPTVSAGLSIFADDPLVATPGTTYFYTSYGWNLISAVIEGASGEPFLSYMREQVFKPMQMDRTVADNVLLEIDNRSTYYVKGAFGLTVAPAVDNSYKWAGGGFLATSEDLVRLAFGHLRPTLLTPETVQEWWTSQATSNGTKTGYGIGWRVDRDAQGRERVGHTGGSMGGTTYLGIYPEQELVIVMVSNLSSAQFGDLPEALASLFWEPEA